MATHEVTNQVPALPEHDVLAADPGLLAAVARWGDPDRTPDLHALGRLAGGAAARDLADRAERHPPVLRTHSPTGERVDEVEFDPAWHALLETAVGHGLTAEPWTGAPGSGAHAHRAAGFLTWSQAEAGHLCPVSMTYAAAPALAADPVLGSAWLPRLASRTYDPGLRPVAGKAGALTGMGMTEKQGGSDVRANTTRAAPDPAGPLGEGSALLTGHKWFCSAPMSDAFLVLAQAPGGLTCYLLPRVLPDGSRNVFALQRLKDKLGNRSNASSEVELDGTWAARLGDEGRGIRTIIEMVAATRLDCVLGSAALMRAALVRAVHHARHRRAFGTLLVDQPLMRNVLADLALESEAATLLGMRLAHAVDAGERAFARIGVAVAKFWVCKRGPGVAAEALECLGGNGYVEENGLARLYREAPLNSVWEGSGNVNALDVLRALQREPESVEALLAELDAARGADPRLDAALGEATGAVRAATTAPAQATARSLVERLAVTLQASLVVRHAPTEVADAFLAGRVAGGHGACYGTLGEDVVAGAAGTLLDRAGTEGPVG